MSIPPAGRTVKRARTADCAAGLASASGARFESRSAGFWRQEHGTARCGTRTRLNETHDDTRGGFADTNPGTERRARCGAPTASRALRTDRHAERRSVHDVSEYGAAVRPPQVVVRRASVDRCAGRPADR